VGMPNYMLMGRELGLWTASNGDRIETKTVFPDVILVHIHNVMPERINYRYRSN
jgi:hypothetical protein